MRYISATTIHPISSPAQSGYVLVISDDGIIEDLLPESVVDPTYIEFFEGDLMPGFVNAHCHLELSHLRGRFPEKTGLPDFLNKVVSQREAEPAVVAEAMRTADQEMWENGIMAVGDICNKADSFSVKSQSHIHYHSFVELLAFDPDRAVKALAEGNSLLEQLNQYDLTGSLVPHAPYSVSPALVFLITRQNAEAGQPTSIHMMESNDETEFFVQGTGLYRRLYHDMDMPIDFFEPSGKTSLESMLPWFHPMAKTLLVHNTIATSQDVFSAVSQHANLWWCFCPNANLYIEDRLPDISQLLDTMPPGRIVLGTDSLASNHQLSIWEEIRSVRQAFPDIPLETILPWATLNGARYLGLEQSLGSFEPGKSPGVLLLQEDRVSRIL